MIQITPHMRILVAVEPVDFRAGIDGRGVPQAAAGRTLRSPKGIFAAAPPTRFMVTVTS
jgi:hypothetical protein